jgi:hypothetical protein
VQKTKLQKRIVLMCFYVALLLFLTNYLIPAFNNQIDKNPLAGLSLIISFVLQTPIAFMGNLLSLPISGGNAQLTYNFNALGYTLTIIFWVLISTIVWWCIDKIGRKR